jgi:hypothetical protein
MKKLKMALFTCLFFCVSGCIQDKRLTIDIIEVEDGYYEWYFYSYISNFSPDHIDFVDKNCNRTLIFKGRGVYNFRLKNGILVLDCFDCDTIEFDLNYKDKMEIIASQDTLIYFGEASLKKDSLRHNVKFNKFGCLQYPPIQPGGQHEFK